MSIEDNLIHSDNPFIKELNETPTATLIASIYGEEPGKNFTEFIMILDHDKFIPGTFIGTKYDDYQEQVVIQKLPEPHDDNFAYTVMYATEDNNGYIPLINLTPGLIYKAVGTSYGWS